MRARAAIVAALVVASLAACGERGEGLRFSAGDVEFASPDHLGAARLPLTLSWTDPTGLADGMLYAVFVDRPPVPPGHNISTLVDEQCVDTDGCPDARYLAGLGVYLTRSTSLLLDVLPSGGATTPRSTHDAYVVVVDQHGFRQGELAATVRFFARTS